MIASDLPDFRGMASAEEMAIDFFPPDSARQLTQTMYNLLTSPERQRAMAEQNYAAALKMTLPAIVGQYRASFNECAVRRREKKPSSRIVSTFRSLRSMLYGDPLSSGRES